MSQLTRMTCSESWKVHSTMAPDESALAEKNRPRCWVRKCAGEPDYWFAAHGPEIFSLPEMHATRRQRRVAWMVSQ